MAEYYPLLARAVSAQSNASKETRQGIYDRARKALLGQLRAHEPPLPEEDIQREAKALEDAIARVEDEIEPAAPPLRENVAAASSSKPMSLAERARIHRENLASHSTAKKNEPSRSRGNLAAVSTPAVPPAVPPPVEGPAPDSASGPEPAIPPVSSDPVPLRGEKTFARGFAPAVHSTPPGDVSEASAPVVFGEMKPISFPADQKTVPPGGLLWKFGRPRQDGEAAVEPGLSDDGDAWPESTSAANGAAVSSEPRPEQVRPLAPLAAHKKSRSGLRWFFVGTAAVLVGGMAIAAFMLKDEPTRPAAHTVAATPAAEKPQSKIVDRIGVGPTRMDAAGSAAGSLATQMHAEAVPPAAPTPAPAPGTPPSAPSAGAPPGQQSQVNSLAATTAPAANSQAPLPVAQRAALLVQAPTSTDSQAIATFVGTVVWRLETVSHGAGHPPELAVRALIDIPDAHFKASMLLEKNDDASLPASHTMELRFDTDSANSALGAVKQIDTPQMRKEDSPAGDSLSGIPTPITSNYFLVGLTKGDPAQAHNIDLMQGAGWFDVPMLLANGRIAKVTFEKGIAGQKALSDAFASWGN